MQYPRKFRQQNSQTAEIDLVHESDYRGIDGGLRAAHAGHGAEAFHGDQYLIADSGIHGVQSDHRITALGAIEIERLDQQRLTAHVALVFLCGYHFANDAGNQHYFFPLTGRAGDVWTEPIRSIESTIPTTVLSVGTSLGRNGKLDSLPRHQ